jgi:hypothetical protein
MSVKGHSLPISFVLASYNVCSTPKADIRFQRNIRRDGANQRHRKCLFDHLIGELLDIHRQFEAERLGGFQINDKLELGRLLDRDVGGLNAA